MGKGKNWTNEEKEYLADHYGQLSYGVVPHIK